jgi:hypothetical protein
MRFVFYAIFIYLAYIGLRTIIKMFSNQGQNKTPDSNKNTASPRRTKFNPDEIEDAEYEEIKKP